MKKNFCSLGHVQMAFGLALLASCSAIGQVREISGTVTGKSGALRGVSVFQEGKDQIVVTGDSGRYQIKVSGKSPVLVFRSEGYPVKRVEVGDIEERNDGKPGVLNVVLGERSDELNKASDTIGPAVTGIGEIVLNAGYYKVRDKERTGSIAKISAKDIGNQPVLNVLSAAQGRVAGVNIVQNSGMPGGGYDIQIRGKNSLRALGNNPLYVVDGVPVGGEMASQFSGAVLPASSINPLNSINPTDIESIEILKDADATSIYGSRGANGVVLVTTKKGKNGKAGAGAGGAGNLGLNVGTSYAMSSVITNLTMMKTSDYLRMRRQAYQNDGITVYPANAYDINGVWDQAKYTDWRKELIGNTADAFTANISLNGGNERTGFLVGYGHNEQSTVFSKGFKYKADNLSANISHSSEDKRFQLSVSSRFSLQRNNVLSEDITRQAFLMVPNAPALYLSDGNLNWENNTFNNPAGLYNSSYSYENKQFLTNMNVQYELLEHWFLKFSGGLNYQSFDERSLKPNTMYNPASYQGLSSASSQSYKSNQDRFSFILEPQLSWQMKKGRHALDVLVGTTFQRDTGNQGSMIGIGFESNAFIENIGAARTRIITDQIKTEYRYAAFFGRVNYQYAGRYILNVTGRRDGSSRFGPNNKFANFGAVGAAWIFSQEGFLKNKKWLSFGKLRSSYGTTGSDNIGDYGYLDTYNLSEYLYNNTAGLNPSRLYNPDYSWEKTTKLEAALELGFLKNRINLTTAWYRNRSSSQLVGYQLPSITGFPSVLANLDAVVENSGWELELSGRPFSGGSFQWESSVNISFPKNKLVSFPGLAGSTYANTYVIGQPITSVKVYQYEGIDPATGLYRFKDFNGDGKITAPDDRQAVENIGVRYFGGWNNTLRFKNWNLSFLFQFVKQRNWNYNNIMPIPGTMNNQPQEVLDVWSAENPGGSYMPYSSGSNGIRNQLHVFFMNSTAAVSDASFIRLKNLELGYQVPVKRTFKSVKVYFQGQNLLTFTKYFGPDPEFRNIGFLPPLRTYSMGVLVTL
ncbi:UNVERIFIED_CONTAM: SusC/RagA family TonB-linked outer membrane protein [Ralstonia mannitolilytica]